MVCLSSSAPGDELPGGANPAKRHDQAYDHRPKKPHSELGHVSGCKEMLLRGSRDIPLCAAQGDPGMPSIPPESLPSDSRVAGLRGRGMVELEPCSFLFRDWAPLRQNRSVWVLFGHSSQRGLGHP